MKKFKNFSTTPFTGFWNNEPEVFAPGEEKYLEDFKADHYCRHLVDREIQLDSNHKKTVDDPSRSEYEAKCLFYVESDGSLLSEKTQILNKNMSLHEDDEIARETEGLPERKKAGRPKKLPDQSLSESEEEFSDLKK